MFSLPRIYAVLGSDHLPQGMTAIDFAEELLTAGITLLQYRNKSGNARLMLNDARALRHAVGDRAHLIMNDRADLCLAAAFDGVHVGQEDLSPQAARAVIGDKLILGVSTHNPEQVCAADLATADYIAIGPVFPTGSKINPDPVIGLEGVRLARSLTRKPLVAIGGITRQNCRSVIDAGADSVAVISDLLVEPHKSAEAFLRVLR
jgi:thiamine-phosphate pyrophosphorylase